jgi:hypothetical protein
MSVGDSSPPLPCGSSIGNADWAQIHHEDGSESVKEAFATRRGKSRKKATTSPTLARRSRVTNYHDRPQLSRSKRQERQSLASAVVFCQPAKSAADTALDAVEPVTVAIAKPRAHFLLALWRQYPTSTLRSGKKRQSKQRTKREWEKRWQAHQHRRMYFTYAPTPHKSHIAAHSYCKKALSSIVVQMKTDKTRLNSYLHGIRPDEAPSDRCRGCLTSMETVNHVFLDCVAYQAQRRRHWKDGIPNSLREIFTDAEKTVTAARLRLSLALLNQFSRTNRRTPSAPEGEQDQQ